MIDGFGVRIFTFSCHIHRPVKTENGDAENPPEETDNSIKEETIERLVAVTQEDHAYLSSKEERRERARAAAAARLSGELTSCSKTKAFNPKTDPIDYRTMEWPRDALYLPYEPNFEWVKEGQVIGQDAYICDCCDPAKRRKSRRREETSSEEEESEEEKGEEEGDLSDSNSKASTSTGCGSTNNGEGEEGKNGKPTLKLDLKEANNSNQSSDTDSPSNSKSSTPTPTPTSAQPGWFGKGRRKRQRFS